jgi:hypothetical protein
MRKSQTTEVFNSALGGGRRCGLTRENPLLQNLSVGIHLHFHVVVTSGAMQEDVLGSIQLSYDASIRYVGAVGGIVHETILRG